MKAAFALFTLIVLTGCTPAPAPVVVTPVVQPVEYALKQREPDTCGAADVGVLLGQTASAVSSSRFLSPSRVVPQGGIVTQEYDPARINFFLDGNGVVSRIACG